MQVKTTMRYYTPIRTVKKCVCVFSCVWLFAIPWTVACQASLSLEFSIQEHRSGLPFPPPGDLPNPRIEPTSPALAGRFFSDWATREALQNKKYLWQSIPSPGKNLEKLNHSSITVIIWNGTATPANSLAASYKTKHSILYESAIAFLGFILKKWKIYVHTNQVQKCLELLYS